MIGRCYINKYHSTTSVQARLAQSVERKALNLVVVGSRPTVGVRFFFLVSVLFSSSAFSYFGLLILLFVSANEYTSKIIEPMLTRTITEENVKKALPSVLYRSMGLLYPLSS